MTVSAFAIPEPLAIVSRANRMPRPLALRWLLGLATLAWTRGTAEDRERVTTAVLGMARMRAIEADIRRDLMPSDIAA